MSAKQSFGGFFKEGTRYFNGVDEVVLRNIDAAVDLSNLKINLKTQHLFAQQTNICAIIHKRTYIRKRGTIL